MNIVRATGADVRAVFADLSEVSRVEYDDGKIEDVVARTWDHDAWAIVDDDGRAIAVYGFLRLEGDMHSWFVASGAFFADPRATRFVKRQLAQHVQEMAEPIYCVSTSPHPQARRWLRLVGFRERAGFLTDTAVLVCRPWQDD